MRFYGISNPERTRRDSAQYMQFFIIELNTTHPGVSRVREKIHEPIKHGMVHEYPYPIQAASMQVLLCMLFNYMTDRPSTHVRRMLHFDC